MQASGDISRERICRICDSPPDPANQEAGMREKWRRWVVERTFAWIGRYRRMSKDYEYLTETSEAMIYATMIRLVLKRLAQAPTGIG